MEAIKLEKHKEMTEMSNLEIYPKPKPQADRIVRYRLYEDGELVHEDGWKEKEHFNQEGYEYDELELTYELLEYMRKFDYPASVATDGRCKAFAVPKSIYAGRGDPTLLNYLTIYDMVRLSYPEFKLTRHQMDKIWQYLAEFFKGVDCSCR